MSYGGRSSAVSPGRTEIRSLDLLAFHRIHKDACHDLTKIFRENRQLQQIMQQTKIWATEEIILPTLVRPHGV